MVWVKTMATTSADLDIFIISWTGQHANARAIEESLSSEFRNITVIYSDQNEQLVVNEHWVRVPNSYFFAGKFELIIRRYKGRILLMITAVVQCSDWPAAAHACRTAFDRHANLGVWAPNIENTEWTIKYSTGKLDGTSLHKVIQTDSIVWALATPVVDRMKKFDYSQTVYGWGIESAAGMFCNANGFLVVIDESIPVHHPKGRGYHEGAAKQEMRVFLRQLSPSEVLVRQKFFADLNLKKFSAQNQQSQIRRNAPCFCGSGKRFKHCHGSFPLANDVSESSA